MREVKVRFTSQDVELIDSLAKEKNVSRSSFIRSRIVSTFAGPLKINQVSSAIRARANSGLSRQQADHCAAIAISAILDATP